MPQKSTSKKLRNLKKTFSSPIGIAVANLVLAKQNAQIAAGGKRVQVSTPSPVSLSKREKV